MTGPGLQVINAGYPKTGTKTIHEALKVLGHNVCDSQENVYSHWQEWERVWTGSKEEGRKALRELYAPGNKYGYTAVCDTPTCAMWETLLDEFPEAKVILVVRDDEKWWNSLLKHVAVERQQFLEMWFHRCFGPLYRFVFNHSSRPFLIYMDFVRPLVLGPEDPTFRTVNKDVILTRKRQHDLYVQQNCPKDKLLVYRIGEGWEPICKFLGVPVPKEPFPHVNRLGSVIKDLANHPDYIRVMKRQFLGWFLRALLIGGAVYVSKNPAILPIKLCFRDNLWQTIGTLATYLFLFKHA